MLDALDPQRLRLLVELKRRGSISAAADACRMGQPSATKHLETLEAATDARLVERDGRASRLTEAGEVVATHAQRVLDTLEGMQSRWRARARPRTCPNHAYLVTDHTGADDPWLVLTGDALLVGDAGRPGLHAHDEIVVVNRAGRPLSAAP